MSLMDFAKRMAREAIPVSTIMYGGSEDQKGANPWLGSMRSVDPEDVPNNYVAGGSNFHFKPRSRTFIRRNGQTQKFDTFGGSAVGMLPAKWGGRARWMEEYNGALNTDGIPSLVTLVTKETVVTGLDDGRFSSVWVRDQVLSTNYTLGSEFSATTYPDPGAEQSYKYVPLWYESGQGGITRGVDEFRRRFWVGGSRRFAKVGNWHYFPSRYGTPARWDGGQQFTGSEPTAYVATATVANPQSGADTWGISGGFTAHGAIAANDDATSVIALSAGGADTFSIRFTFAGLQDSPIDTYRIKFRARMFGGAEMRTGTVGIQTTFNGQVANFTGVPNLQTMSSSWLTYDSQSIGGNVVNTGNPTVSHSIDVVCTVAGGAMNDTLQVSYLEVIPLGLTASSSFGGRLMPSGPFQPTHSGTIVKGAAITTEFMRPSADVTDNTWVNTAGNNTDLYAYIDDTTVNDADYIQTTVDDVCEVATSNLSTDPIAGDAVTLRYRGRRSSVADPINLTVELYGGATLRVTRAAVALGSGWQEYSATLTDVEIAAITGGAGGWNDIRIRFTPSGTAAGFAQVSRAFVEFTPAAAGSEGGWKGKDRFFYSMAYRFEDDSIWMPCTPRFPNETLPDGFNMFTVDESNPTISYSKLTWTNLPTGPKGTKAKLLLRGTKIDFTADDNLLLNPTDLRVVDEIPNEATTYDDYKSEDLALELDAAKLLIRYDHNMSYRARHIASGDMRLLHTYGGLNPCAIEIAPVGRAADYDLVGNDETDALYGSGSQYFSVQIDPTGTNGLRLTKISAAAVTTNEIFAFATYDTLQKLVDRINATTATDAGGQWRAQLAPGALGDTPTLTGLTPHFRLIQSCVVVGQTISKATGGLSAVPVGAFISGTGVTTGAYVSVINSDFLLTFVGTITPATVDLTFYADTGDSASSQDWHQRVIANSLPAFIYHSKDALDEAPIDKQAVFMTVANPAQAKSAPNCFSNKIDNIFHPPQDAGISMGGAGVKNGFVVPFANKTCVIRCDRDQGTGEDKDYRIEVKRDNLGCCAWNTVVPGDDFAVFLSPQGMMAADLDRVVEISQAIHVHAPVATGDFAYEIPKCIAATARDIDYDASDTTIAAHAHARIMRGALWVNYRASGSHPNREVCQDYSTGDEQSGLQSLFRAPGVTHGWSVPLVRSVTVMSEGRRSDGLHLYAWNDENAGSTGDGRIDEIETSDTDNGTAIAGDGVETPWFRGPSGERVSAQEIRIEHSAPTGSTGSLEFHRSYDNTVSTLTPSTSNTLPIISELKMLPQAARAATKACFVGYKQATGGAREIKSIRLKVKVLPTYQ